MQRAATTISGNVFAGCARSVKEPRRHFLTLAQRGLQDVAADAEIAYAWGLLDTSTRQSLMTQLAEVFSQLNQVTSSNQSPTANILHRHYRTPSPSPHEVAREGGMTT
jgi:four helix bundle protein